MVRFSICNELFERWSLEKVFESAAALGYDGLEIAPYTLAESVAEICNSTRSHIRELSKRSGLEVVGIHWVLRGTKGLHLTSIDPEVRHRTKTYLKELARFCGETGGKIIVFGSPDQRTIPSEARFGEAWGWAVETFGECSEYASRYDVTICIEPLRRRMTNFINTVDEALKLIRDVDHKNFGLILDVYAMLDEKEPVDSLIVKGGKYLRHFHVNDDNMRGPGFGSVDYKKVVNGLESIGYKGFVSVEFLVEEQNPEKAAKLSIENLRKFFAET